MRRVLGLVVIAACWSTPPPAAKPPVTPEPEVFSDAVITGRVLLNGKPVAEIGISWVKTSSMMSMPLRAVVARQTPNGFKAHIPPGTWVIVIAGRGFARKLLLDVKLPAGQVTALGDIKPNHGFTVSGQVVDTRAQPVVDAEVTLRNSHHHPIDDSMQSLINGDYYARTDDQGRYRIDGVIQTDLSRFGGPQIRARRTGVGGSLPVSTAIGNVTENVVLQPAGAIEGFAPAKPYDTLQLTAVPPLRGLVFEPISNGTFRVTELPAGDYDVSTHDHSPKRVTVVANQTTTVTFP